MKKTHWTLKIRDLIQEWSKKCNCCKKAAKTGQEEEEANEIAKSLLQTENEDDERKENVSEGDVSDKEDNGPGSNSNMMKS